MGRCGVGGRASWCFVLCALAVVMRTGGSSTPSPTPAPQTTSVFACNAFPSHTATQFRGDAYNGNSRDGNVNAKVSTISYKGCSKMNGLVLYDQWRFSVIVADQSRYQSGSFQLSKSDDLIFIIAPTQGLGYQLYNQVLTSKQHINVYAANSAVGVGGVDLYYSQNSSHLQRSLTVTNLTAAVSLAFNPGCWYFQFRTSGRNPVAVGSTTQVCGKGGEEVAFILSGVQGSTVFPVTTWKSLLHKPSGSTSPLVGTIIFSVLIVMALGGCGYCFWRQKKNRETSAAMYAGLGSENDPDAPAGAYMPPGDQQQQYDYMPGPAGGPQGNPAPGGAYGVYEPVDPVMAPPQQHPYPQQQQQQLHPQQPMGGQYGVYEPVPHQQQQLQHHPQGPQPQYPL